MHELGVVFHIIESVEKVAEENHVEHVERVTLEVGEVSTIVHTYLLDCWKWAVERSDVMKGCKLEVEHIPAITYCEDCQQTYSTLKYAKICPYCKSEHTYLIQGSEVNIKEIEVT